MSGALTLASLSLLPWKGRWYAWCGKNCAIIDWTNKSGGISEKHNMHARIKEVDDEEKSCIFLIPSPAVATHFIPIKGDFR